jgi:hypothetical protein
MTLLSPSSSSYVPSPFNTCKTFCFTPRISLSSSLSLHPIILLSTSLILILLSRIHMIFLPHTSSPFCLSTFIRLGFCFSYPLTYYDSLNSFIQLSIPYHFTFCGNYPFSLSFIINLTSDFLSPLFSRPVPWFDLLLHPPSFQILFFPYMPLIFWFLTFARLLFELFPS